MRRFSSRFLPLAFSLAWPLLISCGGGDASSPACSDAQPCGEGFLCVAGVCQTIDGDQDSDTPLVSDGDKDADSPLVGDGDIEGGEKDFPSTVDGDPTEAAENEASESDETHCLGLGGHCYIDKKCYADGETKAGNNCQVCRASENARAFSLLSPGSVCSTGDPCQIDTRCDAQGSCSGGTSVSCVSEGTTCGVRRICNGTSACTVTYPDAASTCDDSDPCTYNDHCDGNGACVAGAAITCTSDSSACGPKRTCNGTSSCAVTYPDSKVGCDDGRDCTYNDHCDGNGSCVSGATLTCSSDACKTLSCNGTSHCAETDAPASTPCEDGNLCTYNDHCDGSGKCTGGTTVTCTNDTATCGAQRTCNGSANCAVSYPNTQTRCEDGNLCTYDDHCDGSGKCASGTDLSCEDGWGECAAHRVCNGTSKCTTTYPDVNTPCTKDYESCYLNTHCNGYGTCTGTRITCPSDTFCLAYTCNGTPTCVASYSRSSNCPVVVTKISANVFTTCAITDFGAASCWGDNASGQCGSGTTDASTSPTSLIQEFIGKTVDISVGQDHACAVSSDGNVYCWGKNGGLLGDGGTADSLKPVKVSGLPNTVKSVFANRTLSCALTQGGALYCWGNNTYGQLGDGTSTSHTSAVAVYGLTSGVTAVAVGSDFTCAIVNGAAKCWGDNDFGQLGDESTRSHSIPLPVSGLSSGMSSISAGDTHACATTSSGKVYCWGYNSSGQLGTSSSSVRGSSTPLQISGVTNAKAVSCGPATSCTLSNSGYVQCYGTPNGGVSISQGASQVTVGSWYACALSTTGKAYCWGKNAYGQLGNGTTTDSTNPVLVNWDR